MWLEEETKIDKIYMGVCQKCRTTITQSHSKEDPKCISGNLGHSTFNHDYCITCWDDMIVYLAEICNREE